MVLLLNLLVIVISLILMITLLKINPFLSFLFCSLLGAFLLGIPLSKMAGSIQKGVGEMLGSVAIIICLGAMLGKLVAERGAAKVIADTMIKAFGMKRISWALLCTGFIIGIPLFYTVGFVLCIPIIFSLVYQYKLSPVYIGLPMLAALSVAHGFLPPHPSPVALISLFHADMGKTLFLGLILAIPAIILAGPLFAETLKNIVPTQNPTIHLAFNEESRLPSVFNSFFSALLPVFLLVFFAGLRALFPNFKSLQELTGFLSDPSVLMIIAVIIASVTLGRIKELGMKNLMDIYEKSIREITMILLIIGSSGALKQVLIDGGASQTLAGFFLHFPIHPFILGWMIAAIIRISLGSATVAGLTTAGILLPVMNSYHVNPSLMVLAIGSGSLMFSHVNDPGFWMFKEYFGLSMKDTFRSWSLMETLVSIIGIAGVMVLNWVL